MQTRRRHHLQDNNDSGILYETQSLNTQQQQQQQQYQQQQFNTTSSVFVAQTNTQLTEATGVYVGNSQQASDSVDTDDKYQKAQRRTAWDLRKYTNFSTHIQTARNFIQQPLSAAAAVVTGNHTTTNQSNNYTPLVANYTENSYYKDFFEEEQLVEEIFVMAAKDRTSEFTNAIRSLQARNISRAINVRDPRKVKQVQSYTDFMNVAKYIGKNIASTYAKLEKLTLLAKKRSLFDDRPHEIQELTYIIKGDLNALNQQIARLQEISKENRRSHTGGKHLMSHSSNMVLALQSKLANMSSDFKQILEVRTENLKQQKTRRDQFGQGPQLSANSVPPATAKQGSLLLSEENQAVSIDMSGDATPLLSGQQRLQTQQQVALYDQSDNYLQERAETMQNIESTIVELGGIFQQLATMVKEQEEIVERIDTNVQDAELNIEAAHGEILKYFQSVSKNRWLMIKIFGVLIFFFIFFVIFMA